MENQIVLTQLQATDYQDFFQKGISYAEYLARFIHEVESKAEGMYAQYLPMNLQRTKRVGKTLHLQEDVWDYVKNLTHKVNWLIISENWCGDASQIMPILNGIAQAAEGMIDLRIVYRDENPTLIDAHLTNGGKSVPKLIQLDTNFNITGTWGPRPAAAQKLVVELKSNPLTADKYADMLHKWYADDKSISTQNEILALLKGEN